MRTIRLICVAAALVFAAEAQVPAADRFEVAAIHLNPNGPDKTDFHVADGHLSITSASLETLVRTAYEVLDTQIAEAPAWFDADKFDIQAKTALPEQLTFDRLKPLLRNLLADRFQLRTHREVREMSVYVLSVDKGGAKFQASTRTEGIGMNTRKGPGAAKLTAVKIPMSLLATNIGRELGRVVVDKTGLQGDFDFTLVWDPEQSGASDHPSLFTALREQLGLKLEAQKAPAEMLVIDHAERPSEN